MYRDVRMHVCISVLRSVSLSTRWTVRKCQAMIGLRAKQATRGRGEFENDFSERYLRTHFTNSEDAATPPTLLHPHRFTPHSFTPPLLIHTQHHRFPHHTDYVTAIWHFHVTYFRLGPEDHVYAFNPPQDPAWLFSLLHLKWLVKGQLTWHNVVHSVDILYSMYIQYSLYDHSKPMFSTGTNREAGIDNWNPFSKMLNNDIITSDINHSGRPSLPLRALLQPYVSTLFLS